MKLESRGLKYIYDTKEDKCIVIFLEYTKEYENPYEGLAAFFGSLESAVHRQLAKEIVLNGRDKWLGMKKE